MGMVGRRCARAGAISASFLTVHRVAQPTQDEPSLQELGAALAVLVLHPGAAGRRHTRPRPPPAGCAQDELTHEPGSTSGRRGPQQATNAIQGGAPAAAVRVRALPASRALSLLLTQSGALASRTLSVREPLPIPAPLAARSLRAARAALLCGGARHAWRAGLSAWCTEAGRLDRWALLGLPRRRGTGCLGRSSTRSSARGGHTPRS